MDSDIYSHCNKKWFIAWFKKSNIVDGQSPIFIVKSKALVTIKY